MQYNPAFKRKANLSPHPGRSPSPPRAHIEPLSPHKPKPMEPHFNYPALNNHVDYHVRPEQQPVTETPKQRVRSAGRQNDHQRTPSTIDALAEAALAVSPSYQSQACPPYNGFARPQQPPTVHRSHEPPHKRARSDVVPSSVVSQYASRPATSYECNKETQNSRNGQVYDSRVEEAALLLNFRTGGWPTTQTSPQAHTTTGTVATGARPHANSFPRDQYYARPVELGAQAPLLPPYNGQSHRHQFTQPTQEHTTNGYHGGPSKKYNASMQRAAPNSIANQPYVENVEALRQTQTPPQDGSSRAISIDVAVSETSESVPGKRRGWPKGKPRTSGGRKTVAEKAASKRAAAARKKTPDLSKSGKPSTTNGFSDWDIQPELNRRKSFSGGPVTGMLARHSRPKSVPPDTPMIIRLTATAKPMRRNKEVTADTVCAGCETARETRSLNPELDEWISCNGCKMWFHVDCAGFKKAAEVRDVDKYFCVPCEPTHGKTTYVRKSTRAHAQVDYAELQRGVLKTSEESQEHHYIQPIKDGTFRFDPETFPRMRPEVVTREFFERSGVFTEPICIPADWNPRPWRKQNHTSDGEPSMIDGSIEISGLSPEEYEYDTVPNDGQDLLDMVMPEELTVRQVCNLVGPEIPLDVIDVKTQNSGQKWTLGRWADYYEEEGEDKPIRNVISLEVSQSKLGRLLRRPKIVRDIDLQDDIWPQEEMDRGKWPKVQYYCLMSVADSYTDFHIDFGGSSVYYHILKGKKTFFFIPPKSKHLKAYEEWNDSPQQNYTFLPNITGECYRVDLSEGDTMLIPSGWIHAVWTPETSLVIGGNFLTRMSFRNQFKVVDIEKANETPMKFRYPFFQKIMWYTAIKYLRDDPLPKEVSQLFNHGQRFARPKPIWADFDGEIAANDDRPGAKNARYYGQSEMDGLPELANFIFRTVMLVMGRIEGVTADRMKRVNTSIPKGHGEPLEIAKTFALWVAWKRGNEDPPAWAHPDAVLPNSKEEGPPKKLSARALKDMERKEAIAAFRVVSPERQSERVRNAATSAAPSEPIANLDFPENTITTPEHATSFHPSQHSSNDSHPHQTAPASAPAMAQPMAMMASALPGAYLSTPKTSVLGPKRVACDACRKRRIKCKHKDMVMQVTPDGVPIPQTSPGLPTHYGQGADDSITVSPYKTNHAFATDPSSGPYANGINGIGPLPGTSAYVNASIPMAMNGVGVFGDVAKRGRTKACFECRKSKRRCVHDDSGNVDPLKAAETPVPRGTNVSKKRSFDHDGTPSQVKNIKSDPSNDEEVESPTFQKQQRPSPSQPARQSQPAMNRSSYPSHSPFPTAEHQQQPHYSPQLQQHSQSAIDPTLFAPSEPDGYHPYTSQSFSYPTHERSQSYNIQSLEQIANDVLDLNGRSYEDYQQNVEENIHIYDPNSIAPMSNGLPTDVPKPDESVDSAISIPESDTPDRKQAHPLDESLSGSNGAAHESLAQDGNGEILTKLSNADPTEAAQGQTIAHPSVESSDGQQVVDAIAQAPTNARKVSVTDLPLYRPPAPLSASPEQSRRQPHLPNGVHHSSPGEASGGKRKRDSLSESARPKSAKKQRVVAGEDPPEASYEDQESLALAKALQADVLGLRRRPSK